ncbi:hypothetical protein ES703_56039 [subsurface metagenome]
MQKESSLLNYYSLVNLVKKALWYVLLLILSSIVLLPLGWMLTVALKPDKTPIFTIPPQWFPTEHWNWENFIRTLTMPTRPFLLYARNSMFLVLANTIGSLITCSMTAFAFARMRFRGSKILFSIVIIVMLIPAMSTMIPKFLMFFNLGLYGTYWPMILPSYFAAGAGNAFFIFLIRQYMKTFTIELDDAAKIDGCSWFQIYYRIILPLCVPVLVVLIVFTFMGWWSALLEPLIYLQRNEQFTVAVGLANFVNRRGTDWNLLMAANLVVMLPMAAVYFFAQKYLIGGIASVGIKG